METDAVTKLAQMHDRNAVGRFLSQASEFTDSCVVALAETPKLRGNPDYPRMFAFSGDPGVAERMAFLYLDGLLPEGGFLFDAFGVVHVDDKPVLMHDAIHEAVDRAIGPLEQLLNDLFQLLGALAAQRHVDDGIAAFVDAGGERDDGHFHLGEHGRYIG